MTVAESNKSPERVSIVKMRAVDVKGIMQISYADSEKPIYKEIEDWIPAWQCFLSDETWSISLMKCGNDVYYSWKRMTTLTSAQIRDRLEGTVEVNRQIWPTIENNDQPTTAEETVEDDDSTPTIPKYRELAVKSPTRFLLHKHNGGQPDEINITHLGDMISLSFVNGMVIAETKDDKRIIGEIIENLPEDESPDKPSDLEEYPPDDKNLDNMTPNKRGETGPGSEDNDITS